MYLGLLTICTVAPRPTAGHELNAGDPLTGAQSTMTSGWNLQVWQFVTIVPPLPDLHVAKVFGLPVVAWVGTTFTAADDVVNQGRGAAPPSMVRYFLSLDTTRTDSDTGLTGGRPVPSLSSGWSSSGTVFLTIPAGTSEGHYFMIACADGNQQVPESNETNNCTPSLRRLQVRQ
jgi:hypothetical protein